MCKSPMSPLLVFAALLIAPVFAADEPQAATKSATQAEALASMDLETLLNVQVTTASKFSQKESEAPGVITVVTKDELERFGAITLSEILERVPGLERTASYLTDRSMVAARGDQTKITGGHILILINGRPTREILDGGIISDVLEAFPVGILERIEVIRGPGSVLYGSNAFSAVVNLITQKAEMKNAAIVTGLGGPGGTAATSGTVLLKRGDLSIAGAVQFHQNPTRYTELYSFFRPVQNVSLPDRSKGAYLGVNYKGLSFMSLVDGWDSASFTVGFPGAPRWRRGFGDLGYTANPTSWWETSFNLTYTRNIFDVAEFPNIHRDSYEALAEWSNSLRVTAKDRLTLGAVYSYSQGTEMYEAVDPAMPIANGHRPGKEFYAQLEHSLLDRVKLIGGFQGNITGNLPLDVVPRFGVVWTPADKITLKALYSGAFRAPSIDETSLHHIGLEGTPGLTPEKVATVDAGISYNGKRAQVGVNYFHSKQTDSIVVVSTPSTVFKYANLGETTFQGVELEGKYYITKELLLLGSLLYQVNQDQTGAENVTPIPNRGVKTGLSYDREDSWTAGVFNIYSGPLDPRYAAVINPSPQPHNTLGANLRVDLSRHLGWTGKSGLALVAHGTNLLNGQVWLPAWGGQPDTIPFDRGRTVYVGLELFRKKE